MSERRIWVDPVDGSIVYVALGGRGVWKTTDAGLSWEQIYKPAPGENVLRVWGHPNNSKYLIIADAHAGTSILKASDDGGETWVDKRGDL
ncbi:MAG: hypothetical protein M5R40_16450 [Anaerolineae bacterium]|nr:hypothetical protein [Anaerolineae bacterium]